MDEAFRALYPRALRVAYRILGDSAEAEDVAAEAMARALASWERVGSLPHLDAWVLRVAANLALDFVRQPTAPLGRVEPVEFEENVAVRLALAEALRTLPPRQRDAIALRYLAGMTQSEVASALGIAEGTVGAHVHRGMRALRAQLDTMEVRMKIRSIEEAKTLIDTGRLVTATVVDRVPDNPWSLESQEPGQGNVDIGVRAWLIRAPADAKRGDELEVEVVAVSEGTRVLVAVPESPEVVSRRRAAISAIRTGDALAGRVSKLVTFGAFVNVGEVDGLAHVSDLGGRSLESLSIGEEVTVEVIATDPPRQRILLRLIDSAEAVGRRRARLGAMREGETLRGRVFKIVTFGVFVDVGGDVIGLAHANQLGSRSLESLTIGEEVTVQVLAADPDRERFSLRLVQ